MRLAVAAVRRDDAAQPRDGFGFPRRRWLWCGRLVVRWGRRWWRACVMRRAACSVTDVVMVVMMRVMMMRMMMMMS